MIDIYAILYKKANGGGAMQRIDREYVRGVMPRRDPDGHKGTFGKVYLLGGSVGYTGAPVLCAAAAERSG